MPTCSAPSSSSRRAARCRDRRRAWPTATPSCAATEDAITATIVREEEAFRRTLKRGAVLLDNRLAELPAGTSLPGDVAFDLYETYGFPLEVTAGGGGQAGVEVDEAGYAAALARAQEISRPAPSGSMPTPTSTRSQDVLERVRADEFVGREEFETKATVLAVVDDPGPEASPSSSTERRSTPSPAARSATPAGSDRLGARRGARHHLRAAGLAPPHRPDAGGRDQPGQEATAAIDVDRRDAIRRNHTGTHVLHWALREVLGDRVKQQGSLVDPDRLRFDFGPADALTPEQIRAIEDLANREILDERARAALRDDEVRGDVARRHRLLRREVRRGRAGPRGGPALDRALRRHPRPGPRRHRPVEDRQRGLDRGQPSAGRGGDGTGPVDRLRAAEDALAATAEALNVSATDVVDGARKRAEEIKGLRKEIDALRRKLATGGAGDLAAQAVDGVVVARIDGLDRDGVRDLAVAVRDRPGIRAVVLGGAPAGGGAALVAAVAADSGLHAGELLADAAKLIKGGGGKAPDLAVAGGKDPEGSTPPSISPAPRSPPVSDVSASPRRRPRDAAGSAWPPATPAACWPRPARPIERSGDQGLDHRRIAELVADEEAVVVVVGLPLSPRRQHRPGRGGGAGGGRGPGCRAPGTGRDP